MHSALVAIAAAIVVALVPTLVVPCWRPLLGSRHFAHWCRWRRCCPWCFAHHRGRAFARHAFYQRWLALDIWPDFARHRCGRLYLANHRRRTLAWCFAVGWHRLLDFAHRRRRALPSVARRAFYQRRLALDVWPDFARHR
jgi:alkylhydroperoxidase family enzyme